MGWYACNGVAVHAASRAPLNIALGPLKPVNEPMSIASSTLKLVACFVLSAASPVQATERWFLLARHGECATVESLKRKVPDLGEINDPHAFAALMRKNGHKVTLSQMSVPKGRAYEVAVPAKDLSLVFVTSDMCGNSVVR